MPTLITAVQESFHDLDAEKLNSVFLSLQMAMEECLYIGGGNHYKLSHMSKDKLRREGRLPVSLICSPDALDDLLVFPPGFDKVNNSATDNLDTLE